MSKKRVVSKKKRKDLEQGYAQGQDEFRQARQEFWDLRNRLLLQNYTLVFDRKKPKHKRTAAAVYVSPTRAVAKIQLNDSYFASSPEDRRHYAVHELVHIFFARIDYLVSDLRLQLSPQVYNTWYESMNREIERAVDALTDIIAPYTLREDSERAAAEKRAKKKEEKRKKE